MLRKLNADWLAIVGLTVCVLSLVIVGIIIFQTVR